MVCDCNCVLLSVVTSYTFCLYFFQNICTNFVNASLFGEIFKKPRPGTKKEGSEDCQTIHFAQGQCLSHKAQLIHKHGSRLALWPSHTIPVVWFWHLQARPRVHLTGRQIQRPKRYGGLSGWWTRTKIVSIRFVGLSVCDSVVQFVKEGLVVCLPPFAKIPICPCRKTCFLVQCSYDGHVLFGRVQALHPCVSSPWRKVCTSWTAPAQVELWRLYRTQGLWCITKGNPDKKSPQTPIFAIFLILTFLFFLSPFPDGDPRRHILDSCPKLVWCKDRFGSGSSQRVPRHLLGVSFRLKPWCNCKISSSYPLEWECQIPLRSNRQIACFVTFHNAARSNLISSYYSICFRKAFWNISKAWMLGWETERCVSFIANGPQPETCKGKKKWSDWRAR